MNTEHLLSEKVAVVTGGASGIGAASARLYAQAGARVVMNYVGAKGGNDTAAAI